MKDLIKLSRTKIELFCQCPRCFYLNVKHKIAIPRGPSFSLNNAVDTLLKAEFNQYRNNKTPHPYMVQHGIDAVPVDHPKLEEWRHSFTGIQVVYENLLLFGSIDDLWRHNQTDEYIVADYKATSSREREITLDDEWKITYKRQMEFYQWLLRRYGLKVSKTGYFVYPNGIKDTDNFSDVLRFNTKVIPYEGSTRWVLPTLRDIQKTLRRRTPPKSAVECKHCLYVEKIGIL